MENQGAADVEPLVDLETGSRSALAIEGLSSDEGVHWSDSSAAVSAASDDNPGSNAVAVADGRVEVEQRNGNWECEGGQKHKKKRSKKPPRPPRPPNRPFSFDAADEKFIKELSELAMQKKARIERMKALKNMKNAKPLFSSSFNFWGIIVTAIFCLIIIWQGASSKHRPNLRFHGSPESSTVTDSVLASVQFYKNSTMILDRSSSNMEKLSGSDTS